ncbi:MAG: TRAP transporter substrate-binding protein [Lachnospiraceae bacterium]|nr:TRAP transporter substrate-binding protein [Lachnospiraceae bacterium]
MRKRMLCMLLGISMAVSLTACGGGAGTAGGNSAGSQTEAGSGAGNGAEAGTAADAAAGNGTAAGSGQAQGTAGSGAGSSGVKTTYLNFAHNRSEEDAFGIAVKEASDRLYEATGGAYAFQIYPSGTYAALGDCMEAVSGGTLDFAWYDTGMDYAERLGVLLSPFCFDSYDHWKAFKKSEVYQDFVQDMSDTCSVHHFGFFTFGFRMVTGNKVWKTPEEFAPVKLRMAVQPPYPAIATVLNCTGEPLDANEVYTALQTGVFDGQENPYSDIISRKFYEVQKYIIKTEHVLSVGGVACSTKCWDSLDADAQAAVTDAVNYILDAVDDATISGAPEQEKFLADQGCEIVTIEDKTPFKDRAYLVFDQYPEFESYYTKIQEIEY